MHKNLYFVVTLFCVLPLKSFSQPTFQNIKIIEINDCVDYYFIKGLTDIKDTVRIISAKNNYDCLFNFKELQIGNQYQLKLLCPNRFVSFIINDRAVNVPNEPIPCTSINLRGKYIETKNYLYDLVNQSLLEFIKHIEKNKEIRLVQNVYLNIDLYPDCIDISTITFPEWITPISLKNTNISSDINIINIESINLHKKQLLIICSYKTKNINEKYILNSIGEFIFEYSENNENWILIKSNFHDKLVSSINNN